MKLKPESRDEKVRLEEVEKGTGVFYIKDESGKVCGYYEEWKYEAPPADDSFVRPTYDLPKKTIDKYYKKEVDPTKLAELLVEMAEDEK